MSNVVNAVEFGSYAGMALLIPPLVGWGPSPAGAFGFVLGLVAAAKALKQGENQSTGDSGGER